MSENRTAWYISQLRALGYKVQASGEGFLITGRGSAAPLEVSCSNMLPLCLRIAELEAMAAQVESVVCQRDKTRHGVALPPVA